jgi:TonB family protein
MSRRWLLPVSAVAHVVIGGAVFLSGAWRIDRLDGGHNAVHIGLMPPPAAAAGPVAPQRPKFTPKEVPKVIVKQLVQLVPKTTETPKLAVSTDQPPGDGSGSGDPRSTEKCLVNCSDGPPAIAVCGNSSVEDSEQCDDGNTSNGDGCSSTCRLEPPRPKPPAIVQTNVLQALRLSGDTTPRPSSATQQMMMRDGNTKVTGVTKLCVGTDGGVTSAATLSSTRYSEYDQAILAAIHTWRYQPYLVDNKPVAVCSSVTFIYTIR